MTNLNTNSRIYLAGHTGLVGSAILRALCDYGYKNILTMGHNELDLTNQADTEYFFQETKPEFVIDAAALVGGIRANTLSPADFFYVNMQIENNLIWSAHKNNVRKFLFLGSACMYPKDSHQPMSEQQLLSGVPEPTNEGYALAKICGSRLCSYIRTQYKQDFISAVPANTYGRGDSFDPEKSHVIPALIAKYHNAKVRNEDKVVLWGSGSALREFIHVDDIASGVIFLLNNYSSIEPINIGTGEEISILKLSEMIKEIVGFTGTIECDYSKPDGMKRRLLNSDKMRKLGWNPKISLYDGIEDLYNNYLKEIGEKRGRD